MKRTRRIAALALSLALCTSAAFAAVEDKFPAINTYPGYADVPAGIWFEANAQLCYETGLIMGSTVGFEPSRNMNLAEVAAITARVCEAVTGNAIIHVSPKPGETLPWYHSYVEYLKRLGVTGLDNPDAPATRSSFLHMLTVVLTPDLLEPINTIAKLPDTADVNVLKFYNAGILTGTDQYGTFDGDAPLSRSEGAAMISRVVRPSLRKNFTPADGFVFAAAGVKPDDAFFVAEGLLVTAEAFLTNAITLIGDLEAACNREGIAFNWNNSELSSGHTFKVYVTQSLLNGFAVTADIGTDHYKNFDLQVFYSKYLDLTGRAA